MLREKRLANVDTNNLSNEGTHFILLKKTTHTNSTKKLSETDIITMIELVIDNVFVMLDGRTFQQKMSFLRVQTVLTFSQTYYRDFSRKTKIIYPDPVISRSFI